MKVQKDLTFTKGVLYVDVRKVAIITWDVALNYVRDVENQRKNVSVKDNKNKIDTIKYYV